MIWLQALPPAICYFLYHWQFFRCVESILKIKPMPKVSLLWTFLVNESVFILCSVLNLHLIANWILFLVLLLAEQLIIYRQSVLKCALFALLGTQMGLAVNILCRSLLAILLNVPLIAFDNTVFNPGNMKRFPILLGFLAVGLLFGLCSHFGLLKRLHLALEDRNTLLFSLCLLVAMYGYLCMNLMVYYIEKNDMVFKLWSMKSSAFVILGECLALFFSIRLGEIAAYRAKSRQSREQLTEEQAKEQALRVIAATDPLTGCENRLQVEPRIKDALNTDRDFCLCFVDMDGLKAVNDQYGHEMGDAYIQAVSNGLSQVCGAGSFLFRYGGDEFLLLIFDLSVSDAVQRLCQVQQGMEQTRRRQNYPFPVGISYGIATRDDGADSLELIQAADTRMYQMKQSKSLKP